MAEHEFQPGTAGKVQIILYDTDNKTVPLYFFTYSDADYLRRIWRRVPEAQGYSAFEASLHIPGDVPASKRVTAEWITCNCGASIADLINQGRLVVQMMESGKALEIEGAA